MHDPTHLLLLTHDCVQKHKEATQERGVSGLQPQFQC